MAIDFESINEEMVSKLQAEVVADLRAQSARYYEEAEYWYKLFNETYSQVYYSIATEIFTKGVQKGLRASEIEGWNYYRFIAWYVWKMQGQGRAF
jgi:hypothetical protein